ncbi:hypothetical protein ACVV5W_14250, partial [Enterococcus faecalis]
MKFTIPENYDQYTLREIFQDLKLPKKDLHLLNMSKEITINDKASQLSNKIHTGDHIFIPTPDEKSNYLP